MAFIVDDTTLLRVVARYLHVLHSSPSADFALGVSAGGLVVSVERGQDRMNAVLEAVLQVRAFLAPNVALSALFGLGATKGDGPTTVALASQLSLGLRV